MVCEKIDYFCILAYSLFRISSAVEQWTVNPLVASSNLAPGVSYNKAVTAIVVTAFFLYRAGDALSYKNIIQVLSFQFSQAEFIVKIFRKGNRYGIGI